jgi:hypothetical protein
MNADFWGNPLSPYQQHLYGLAILPFGFRMLWRGDRPLKFYLSSKVGAIVFNQKALSLNASYVNFNVQAAFGVQIRLPGGKQSRDGRAGLGVRD